MAQATTDHGHGHEAKSKPEEQHTKRDEYQTQASTTPVRAGHHYIALGLAALVAGLFIYGFAGNSFTSKQAEVQTPPSKPTKTTEAPAPKDPWYKSWLRTPDDDRTNKAPSPITKGGNKLVAAPSPITEPGGNRTAAAPSPLAGGSAGSVTTAGCAGIKHTVTLQPGVWANTDKHDACRVVAYVPPGVRMEAMDADGTVYPYPDPNQDAAQEHSVLKVRTLDKAIRFSFSRCPRGTAGVLNWDCSSLTQYAAQ